MYWPQKWSASPAYASQYDSSYAISISCLQVTVSDFYPLSLEMACISRLQTFVNETQVCDRNGEGHNMIVEQ